MALPRKKVPMDKPGVIAARERMKPLDFSVVVPKDDDDMKRWHYAWVNVNRTRQSVARSRGYITVKPEEVETPNAYANTDGGTVEHGDVVLMKMPMHLHKQAVDDSEAYRKAIVRSQMEQSVEMAASAGVKVKHTIKRGNVLTKETQEGYDENDEETVLEV
jgi:hypothetical protein